MDDFKKKLEELRKKQAEGKATEGGEREVESPK